MVENQRMPLSYLDNAIFLSSKMKPSLVEFHHRSKSGPCMVEHSLADQRKSDLFSFQF